MVKKYFFPNVVLFVPIQLLKALTFFNPVLTMVSLK